MRRWLVGIRILITLLLLALAGVYMLRMEYVTQLGQVDNLIGAMPVVSLFFLLLFSLVLLWKRYKGAETSTVLFAVLDVAALLMFAISGTGNWFPLARTLDTTNLEAPAAQIMPPARLPEKGETVFSGELPILDGATALYPVYHSFAEAVYAPEASGADAVRCTNTSGAYASIMAGTCDIIFTAGPSAKQRAAAEAAGSDLHFTPIGREAFVFLVGRDNPVDSLTVQQIKNIFSGKTATWKTLGWPEGGDIIAFQRPEGSGSQTGLQNVMGRLPIFAPRPLPDSTLAGNGRLTEQIAVVYGGVQPALGYSYRYYATQMYPNADTKLLAVQGVYPSVENIANGKYPFSADFYAVTRGEPTGEVRRLIEWMLSEEGQYLVEQVGYIPLSR